MDICIDFDGTCVTHEFPNVGKNIGAEEVLRELVANGHRLILFTMRSDIVKPESEDPSIICKPGQYLTDAVNWFKEKGIPLYGIQSNPTQNKWTTSNKAFGHLYIDDAALGCPLIKCMGKSERPFVDWERVKEMLHANGILSHGSRQTIEV